MQEAYPFTVKPKGKAKDQWDTLELGAAIPGAGRIARIHRPDETAEPLLDVITAPSSGIGSRSARPPVTAFAGRSQP